MTKSIAIYPVTVEEINDWLTDAIQEAEGHDRNVLGTMGIMLEDFSGFIYYNPELREDFMEYVRIADMQDGEIH